MNGTCSVEGCDRSPFSRGWCGKHYQRWWKHGDPTAMLAPHDCRAVPERFWAKVDKSAGPDGCWLWTGGRYPSGYGRFSQHCTMRGAHVVAYELTVGPVPDGLELDHVRDRGCVHRHCVNPAHLEPVTHAENMRRWRAARRANADRVRDEKDAAA